MVGNFLAEKKIVSEKKIGGKRIWVKNYLAEEKNWVKKSLAPKNLGQIFKNLFELI